MLYDKLQVYENKNLALNTYASCGRNDPAPIYRGERPSVGWTVFFLVVCLNQNLQNGCWYKEKRM